MIYKYLRFEKHWYSPPPPHLSLSQFHRWANWTSKRLNLHDQEVICRAITTIQHLHAQIWGSYLPTRCLWADLFIGSESLICNLCGSTHNIRRSWLPGRTNCAVTQDPTLGWMLCCCLLEFLTMFLTRGAMVSFCTGTHKLSSWFYTISMVSVTPKAFCKGGEVEVPLEQTSLDSNHNSATFVLWPWEDCLTPLGLSL